MKKRNRVHLLMFEVFAVMLVMSVALSLGCAAVEPTPTPIPPVPPAPPAAPTAAPAPVTTLSPAARTPTVAPLTPTPTLQYGGNLRWAGLTDGVISVRSLDSIQFGGNPERAVGFVLYNTLTKFAPDFSIQPDLAKSWEVSPDGKAVTMRLQEGVKFQDGTEFTAEAVKWNYERILNPASGARGRSTWEESIERLQVVDKNTIVFHLKKPFRPFLTLHADILNGSGILSPAAVAKLGADIARSPVTTGAFKLKEWSVDNRLIAVANENYWEKGKPYLSQITVLFVPELMVQVAMLRTGEVDLVDRVPPQDLPLLERNPSVKVVAYPTCRFRGIRVSVDRAPWNNAPLREALAYAMDRKKSIDVLLEGYGRPAYSPDGDCFWWSDPNLKPYEVNVAKAKEKLAEAGFPGGVEVEWWAANTATAIGEAEVFQAMAREAGFKPKITLVPAPDVARLAFERKIHLNMETWTPRPDPDTRLRLLFYSKGGWNYRGYNDPQVDKRLDEAVTVFDRAQAKKLYDQIQSLLVDKMSGGYIYLYFPTDFTGINVRVQNYTDVPDRIMRLRDLWLKQ